MRHFFLSILVLHVTAAFSQKTNLLTLQQKASTLRAFLDKQHYKPLVWNDSSSNRLFTKWLNDLDEEKDLFTAGEITALMPFQFRLDEELNGQSWGFFDRSINLYKTALIRYDSLQRSILAKPLDFSKPEVIVLPAPTYAVNLEELQQRITAQVRWKALRYIVADLNRKDSLSAYLVKAPADLAVKEKKAREKIRRQHGMKMLSSKVRSPNFMAQMEDDYLKAIAWCYDPHTTYMNLAEKKDFNTMLSGFEYSAGMDIKNEDDGSFVVNHVEPGGSAWRSGELHQGDKVTKIKKSSGEEKELSEMEQEEVQELLKGSNDEAVELTVQTASGAENKVALSKEKVTDNESIVKSYLIKGYQNYGYIQLPGFYSRESASIETDDDVKFDGCANDVSKEILKLKQDSIAGLILDLRFNGGGSMWEAMQLGGIFIDLQQRIT